MLQAHSWRERSVRNSSWLPPRPQSGSLWAHALMLPHLFALWIRLFQSSLMDAMSICFAIHLLPLFICCLLLVFLFLSFLHACCVLNKVTHSPDCIERVSSCLVSAEGPGNNTLRILRDKCTVKLSSTLINKWNFYKSKQECRLLFCHLFVGIVSQ